MLRLEDHFDNLPEETKHLMIDVGANQTFRDLLMWLVLQYNDMILACDPNAFDNDTAFRNGYSDLLRYRDSIQDVLKFLEKENNWIQETFGKQEK